MEIERDLGQVELWEASLERSLARRGRSRRTSAEPARTRPVRDLADKEFVQDGSNYWRMRRRAVAKRSIMPAVGVGGISTLALLAATLPNALGGRGSSHHAQRVAFRTQGEPRSARGSRAISNRIVARAAVSRPAASHTSRRTTASSRVMPSQHFVSTSARPATQRHTLSRSAPIFLSEHAHGITAAMLTRSAHRPSGPGHSKGSGGAGLGGGAHSSSHRSHPQPAGSAHSKSGTSSHSQPASTHNSSSSGGGGISRPSDTSSNLGSGGYVNPLADANVTPERIDQGVDYAGSGKLEAIGDGQITYVGTSNTGWPGAFIEFRLLDGPDAGRYVFYAESITPAQGLHVGEKVGAGQTLATINGGIEIGWGANVGTETYAMQQGQWSSYKDQNNIPTQAGNNFSELIASLGGPPGKNEG